MEMRVFGRTGMQLSVLGFGCGAVGGLMVRGDALDQERTIARAIAAGVNYFDTAVQYGNGESEKNLGHVLHRLKASNVLVGTKVRLPSTELGRIGDTANLLSELTIAYKFKFVLSPFLDKYDPPVLARWSGADAGGLLFRKLQSCWRLPASPSAIPGTGSCGPVRDTRDRLNHAQNGLSYLGRGRGALKLDRLLWCILNGHEYIKNRVNLLLY
jgi:Aldo/keto reductase family